MRKSNATQAPLFARTRKPSQSAPQRERHAEANALAARVILADPLRHGGPGSLMVAWAKACAGEATVQSPAIHQDSNADAQGVQG